MKIFSTRLTALTSVLLASQPLAAADRFTDVNITTQQVTENVYMLQGAGGNIGVSSGTDGTLIIDDQFASAGKIEKLGGDRPRIVLNTHYHGDHTGGNAEFGRTGVIVAHNNVRARRSLRTSCHPAHCRWLPTQNP